MYKILFLFVAFCLCSCSHHPKIPNPRVMSLANPVSLPEYSNLVASCQKTHDRIQKAQDTLEDKASLVKTVSGIVTGGVGTLGGLVTGTLAAKDKPRATMALGLTTAGLTLTGTLITAFFEPGKQVSEYNRKTLMEINSGVESLNNILEKNGNDQDKWGNDLLSEWYLTVGKLKGICE